MAGYSPGAASLPPTIASDGAAVAVSRAHVSATNKKQRRKNIQTPV
jgi:hypothetical protein